MPWHDITLPSNIGQVPRQTNFTTREIFAITASIIYAYIHMGKLPTSQTNRFLSHPRPRGGHLPSATPSATRSCSQPLRNHTHQSMICPSAAVAFTAGCMLPPLRSACCKLRFCACVVSALRVVTTQAFCHQQLLQQPATLTIWQGYESGPG